METLDERGSGSCDECGAYLSNRDALNQHTAWHLMTNNLLNTMAKEIAHLRSWTSVIG